MSFIRNLCYQRYQKVTGHGLDSLDFDLASSLQIIQFLFKYKTVNGYSLLTVLDSYEISYIICFGNSTENL